jgi:hypothetical protein
MQSDVFFKKCFELSQNMYLGFILKTQLDAKQYQDPNICQD